MIVCIIIMAAAIVCLMAYAVIITAKACRLRATNDELRQSLNDVQSELNSCQTFVGDCRDNVFSLFLTIRGVWDFWESRLPDKFSVPVSDFIRKLLLCSTQDYVSNNAVGQINKYTELCLKLQEEVYDRYVMRKAENSAQEVTADDSQGTC